MPYEKNPDELGALWSKTGAKGEYMTGTINGVNVVCFPANSKSANGPTWRVMKSKPRDEAQPKPAAQPVDADAIPF